MANSGNYRRPWFKKKEPQINPRLVSAAVSFSNEPKHGYYGFKLYFPEESDVNVETLLKCVVQFKKFIKRNAETYSYSDIEAQKSFTVDYRFITSGEDELCDGWKDLRTQIVNNTEFCLNCMGLAMHQSIIQDFIDKHADSEEEVLQKKSLGVIRARLINYEPVQLIKDIRVNNYGKLISLKGTVIKASNIKIMYQYMAFSCSTCTGIQIVKQPDNVFTLPNKCATSGCRAQSNFKPLYNSPYTRTISWQPIKIQELIGSNEFENGRIPRTLECELTEDLVNTCVPGDDVTITGVIRVRDSAEQSHRNKQNTIFLLYLEVISVVNNKSQSEGSYGASERITFNITDYYAIQKIHAEPNLFRFLVQSLCPNIYGHALVKAGLLLALFGGTKSEKTRAESHVLVVGDPGLGKSQMLHACANVAPRGVYVCGNTSTGSGLTVTLTRDGGEFALEAGALMLADQGCCCIDEFDKMRTQHACLLEAMEQQSISIAKAGIVCTLPTRATILAAANPAGGHYNKAKTIAENLKISSPMLSRFDLIFILLDQPSEELDMMLSEHVLALHSGKNGQNSSINKSLSGSSNSKNDSLRGRLSLQNGDEIDHLPHCLFRKYIAYAQKYVNPQISEDAKEVIKDFYFQLRKQYQSGDCTPITTRQLNSLIRLTQARAKAELREEATKEDALDVIDIMKETLIDIFTDGGGILDIPACQSSTKMSTKNQVMKLLRLMQQQAESQAESIFTIKEIKKFSEDAGICPSKFYTVLQSLNIQGFILNKGANKYQLVTADL